MTAKFKILVIGDTCIDEYKYGDVDRLSPEAPVPVIKHLTTDRRAGMAANVVKNIETFGCKVISVLGEESIKTRIIDNRSKQHIVRIDNDVISDPCKLSQLKDLKVDAIVISDYNKGFITYNFIDALKEIYDGPIFVDTKKQDLIFFDGCYVKINEHESNAAKSKCSNLIVTLGEKGAVYKNTHYPAEKVDAVDVCGAGDTFLAALCFKFLESKSIETAILFAIRAASISVQHSGTYVLSAADIENLNK